ncbi:hypothetical protein [Priestia filamentosa]|uniref:hypothetical protein n=1 Tax=Priestia filamentosa TaxID=1402861 RepID=UPI000A086719|nr:hypothetical protein [Priestia filamentosa]MDT3762992.1 hypothetical protein [Priestia filamentosa]OXS69512.1 hypothetical protein B1B01_11130 [Priestia filamentosa]SMF33441.1 hypothetical protein SAMN06296056_102798 [Priestia filamentosa]
MNLDLINSRKNSKDSLQFLKKLEKLALSHKIRSQQDKVTFRKYLEKNLSVEEIKMMVIELELNLNKRNEFYKFFLSLVISFITIISSFILAFMVFLYNVNIQLLVKATKLSEKYNLMDYSNIFNYLGNIWVFGIISLSVVAYFFIVRDQNRSILYLSILKSIKE